MYFPIWWYWYSKDRINLCRDLDIFLYLKIHPFELIRERKYPKIRLWFSEIYFFCLCGLCWLHLLVFFSLVMTIGNIICDKCLHERPAWNTHPQKRIKTQTFRGIFLSRVYKIRVYANHIESKWTKNNGSYYRMQ